MNIALIIAGGSGTRMGQDIPKQFLTIDDCPVVIYTMLAFQKHPEVDEIAVVSLAGWEAVVKAYAKQFNITKLQHVYIGGDTNQQSIHNGIFGLNGSGYSNDDIVMVIDGVRPLVSNRIISENIETCKKYGYAVTGLPCKEVIMKIDQDSCLHSIQIPRENLVRTQTPHTYPLGMLLKAHEEAAKKGFMNRAASCVLMSDLGVENQHFVMGSEKNGLKLTNVEDIELFKALLHTSKDEWIK